MKVPAKRLRPGDIVRLHEAPPQVVLDCWKRSGIVTLVFEKATAMLDPEDEVVTL